MVARTTAAKPSFADRVEAMDRIAVEADRLRGEMLDLVDEDARAFEQVITSFRMPKETPEEQASRAEAIRQAYVSAARPPMLVCTSSLRILELAVEVAEKGNPNAASDAGVAALLAAAALEAGALNVQINLASIGDETLRATEEEAVRAAQARGRGLCDRALKAVQAQLD